MEFGVVALTNSVPKETTLDMRPYPLSLNHAWYKSTLSLHSSTWLWSRGETFPCTVDVISLHQRPRYTNNHKQIIDILPHSISQQANPMPKLVWTRQTLRAIWGLCSRKIVLFPNPKTSLEAPNGHGNLNVPIVIGPHALHLYKDDKVILIIFHFGPDKLWRHMLVPNSYATYYNY